MVGFAERKARNATKLPETTKGACVVVSGASGASEKRLKQILAMNINMAYILWAW
jgi:hypothetical protein